MAKSARFGKGLFQFLEGLAPNNDRDWFNAHKAQYETDLKAPAQEFAGACGVALASAGITSWIASSAARVDSRRSSASCAARWALRSDPF